MVPKHSQNMPGERGGEGREGRREGGREGGRDYCITICLIAGASPLASP